MFESDVNPVIHNWGCTAIPGGQQYCGVGLSSSDGDKAVKVCTCCGSDCNGQEMDWILANDTDCGSTVTFPPVGSTTIQTTVEPESFKCWTYSDSFGQSDILANNTFTGILDKDNATLVSCRASIDKCMKVRYQKMIQQSDGTYSESIYYRWGCYENLIETEESLFFWQNDQLCGTVLETSYGGAMDGAITGEVRTHARLCMCCGAGCNDNEGLDCTESPIFTHTCNAAWSIDGPELSNSVTVGCTDRQVCYVCLIFLKFPTLFVSVALYNWVPFLIPSFHEEF